MGISMEEPKRSHISISEKRKQFCDENLAKLTFMEDRMSAIAINNNPRFAEAVLRRVMDDPDMKVLKVREQEEVSSFGHSARFDALAKCGDGSNEAIEIQRKLPKAFAKTVAWRLSALTFSSLPKGAKDC